MTYRQLVEELNRASTESTRLRALVEEIALPVLDQPIGGCHCRSFELFVYAINNYTELMTETYLKIASKKHQIEG